MLPFANQVVVLGWMTPSPAESRARRIAEFQGASVTFVPLESAHDADSLRRLVPDCAALVVHADVLVRLAGALDDGVEGLRRVVGLGAHVFVYGFRPDGQHDAALRALSNGCLLGVAPVVAGSAFHVAGDFAECTGPFTGLSIDGADAARDAAFAGSESAGGYSVLVRVAGEPFFVRIQQDPSDIFFAACGELANLDEAISCEAGLLPWFSRVVPLMTFLRSAMGKFLWHSENPQACFIIDDPLLKNRYGFLDYPSLLEAMGQSGFSACIAFIPWNYRRTRQQMAEKFTASASALSLCIHGCDHTGAEFAASDFGSLRNKARLALDRMTEHRRLSGVPFDDVMVFPQGLFSSEALKALDACGYLAAVNTDLSPADIPNALMLQDLMDVAVTKFGGFPLFGRHYPKDASEFAFDLFLGKPALVVEHHGYFRRGYGELTAFVRQLNRLDKRLEWHNLATICSQACLKKIAANGDVHVRFFTNRFRLTNHGARRQAYVLSRNWPRERPWPDVTLNGSEWTREQKDSTLTFHLQLDPGGIAEIQILPERPADTLTTSWRPTSQHKARVFVRRILSEVRDNHVDTNRLLAAMLSAARRLRSMSRDVLKSHSPAVRIEG
jgi:hypothetical protein